MAEDNPLEQIEELYETVTEENENENENENNNEIGNDNEDQHINTQDPQKLISKLQDKVMHLEKMNRDLKSKNEGLTKNNLENNSVMLRMSMVGMHRKFAGLGDMNQGKNDQVKYAEIVKEKNDLQQMNEKMLDLLTEKEIENEDLMQQLENVRL